MVRAIERVLPGTLGERVLALLRHEGTAGTAAKGSIAAFIVAAVGVLISFVVQTSLARALGDTEFGTYAVVLGWMNVVLLITKLEQDIVTTRFVGAYAATGDWSHLHGLLRHVPRNLFVRTVAVGTIAAIGLLAIRGRGYDHFVSVGLLAIPLFIVTAQVVVRSAALQGFKHVLGSQMPNVVLRPALFLFGVWLLIGLGGRLTSSMAIAFNAIASAIALIAAQRYLRRSTPLEATQAPPVNAMREWLRVGYGLVFISLAQLTVSQHTDILLVAALLDRTNAAHYTAASQLAQLVGFASTAVMFIVAPLIAELYAVRKLDTLRSFTRATVSVCMAVSFTLLVGIAAFGRPLLGIFGGAFRVAYPAMLLLVVSHFVTASIGALSGWLMTMTGHERPAAWMIGGTAVLNIALSIPLTATYGIVGTASATLITTVIRSLTLGFYLRRRLGLLVLPGSFRGQAA
ncbi:MAG TPA: oligosaccharide flippase family protein [Gemmatimonadaceae bacterium]